MAKGQFHISKDGKVRPCGATQRPCTLSDFDTEEQAQREAEGRLSSTHGDMPRLRKRQGASEGAQGRVAEGGVSVLQGPEAAAIYADAWANGEGRGDHGFTDQVAETLGRPMVSDGWHHSPDGQRAVPQLTVDIPRSLGGPTSHDLASTLGPVLERQAKVVPTANIRFRYDEAAEDEYRIARLDDGTYEVMANDGRDDVAVHWNGDLASTIQFVLWARPSHDSREYEERHSDPTDEWTEEDGDEEDYFQEPDPYYDYPDMPQFWDGTGRY